MIINFFNIFFLVIFCISIGIFGLYICFGKLSVHLDLLMYVHALMFYHDGSVNILVCVLQVLLHTICQRITTFVPPNVIQPEYELGPKIVYSERVNTATTTLYDTIVSDIGVP